MKILHISTSVNASSANTHLHMALKRSGIDSNILVKHCDLEDENIHVINNGFKDKVINKCSSFWNRQCIKKYEKDENMPFSVSLRGKDISGLEYVQEADIIHLHWICNFLSPYDIYRLMISGKKIVWTCHDSWPFTGGCHVRYGCERFWHDCGECPILYSLDQKDITSRIMKNKKKYLMDSPITFIAPSNWMKNNIKNSRLFRNCDCEVIHNTMDLKLFKEKKSFSRLKYRKETSKYHILFGATSAALPYKGFHYLIQLLKDLHVYHTQLAKNIVVHVIGAQGSAEKILKEFECVFWGYVSDQEKMAEIYNLVDVFIYPSIDDNLPNMVMESLACATPVVSFDTGGISDMVVHKENGYLASYKDQQDLLNGFFWVLENNDKNRLGKSGRLKIEREFCEEMIAGKHIELYQHLLDERKRG